jgi:hypothetical protein
LRRREIACGFDSIGEPSGSAVLRLTRQGMHECWRRTTLLKPRFER